MEYWTAKGLAYTAGITYNKLGTQQVGGVDIYASCINITSGVTLYTEQFGTADNDLVGSLVIDTVRGVGYLLGETTGSALGYTNKGGFDILIVAFMLNNGTLLYYRQLGSVNDDHPSVMVVYPRINLGYITGSSNGFVMMLMVDLDADALGSPVTFTTWDNMVSHQQVLHDCNAHFGAVVVHIVCRLLDSLGILYSTPPSYTSTSVAASIP